MHAHLLVFNDTAALDFMNLQLVLEAVTGTPLDQLLHDKVTGPLGMQDTFFNQGNTVLSEKLMSRIAATEYQIKAVGPMEPQRPQPVWGTVSALSSQLMSFDLYS